MIKQRGFTLAEILVVIGVVAIVGAIVTEIFLRSIRGSNQATILAAMKQNGQTILDQMDKTIRGADNVVCVTTSTIVVEYNRTLYASPTPARYTRFRFVNPTSTTNGLVQLDNPTTYSDTMCVDSMVNPVIISDSSSKVGSSITGGSFSRNDGAGRIAGFKDAITVQFSAAPGVDTPLAVSKNIDPVPFSSTVVLR